MKRTLLLISTVLFSVMVWGQKVTLYLSGNQTYEYDISQVDSMVFSDTPTIEPEEIVVTVDANGNADGEHWFEKIDETNFYIDDIKYTAQSGDLVVTGYNQAFFKGAANIISQLKYRGRTMNVVGVSNDAFKNCKVLTSVTISESVTSIGSEAFLGCCNLTDVLLNSNSFVSASRYDTSMKTIFGEQVKHYVIGNSVTSIGNGAFYDCSSLTSVAIGSGVTSIGHYAFYQCSNLTSFTIPDSVNNIGSGAFFGCSSLTSITIPGCVTSIGYDAFSGCSSLTSVIIPNSVTSIGSGAFVRCSSLTSVTIGSGITSIAGYTFDSCTNLTSITIPGSVTSIDYYAFSGCSNLTSVIIPNGVTSIDYCAFSGCSGLTSVTIGSGVKSIGEYAFSGCSSLTDVYCLAENVPNSSFAFDNSSFASATLHVPAGSVEAYKAKEPWKRFKSIVAIE